MQLKTLLNRVHPRKSFVYVRETLVQVPERESILEVLVEPRKNGKPICSSCGRPGSTYDTCSLRRYEFVPLWGIAVVLLYAMRRVECRWCGVKVEQVPWSAGKSPVTHALFLADWAKALAWQEVARRFGVNQEMPYVRAQLETHQRRRVPQLPQTHTPLCLSGRDHCFQPQQYEDSSSARNLRPLLPQKSN